MSCFRHESSCLLGIPAQTRHFSRIMPMYAGKEKNRTEKKIDLCSCPPLQVAIRRGCSPSIYLLTNLVELKNLCI